MNSFAGTGSLVRLILRRDRVLIPIWIFFMALLPMSLASGTAAIYTTDAERQEYIHDLGSSPLLLLFYGVTPADASLGALIFWRSATGIVIMSLIGLLTVIRHTRVEEEAGRRELIGSTVVGRNASLAAALVAVSGASLVMGLLVALGMVSQQTPAVGAFAMGLAWAAAGIVFAAIGAVTAQLTTGAGSARGLGISLLGLAFALRGVGDTTDLTWLSWLSPLGWVYKVQAYTLNQWWLFGLMALFTLALSYVAIALSARRDLGAGLLPPRLGPAQAAPSLRSPLALAWRLHRGALFAWSAGFAVFGLLVGGIAETAGTLLEKNAQITEIMERLGGKSAIVDVYIVGCLGLCAIVVSGYAIGAALKMRTEEASLRTEPILAGSVGRLQWAAGHLVFALLGPAVVMGVAGLSMGLIHGLNTGNVGREIPRVLAGAMVQLPAIWILSALTVAAFGLLPRLSTAIGWIALSVCLLLGQVGALLQLSQSILDISPFTHIPRVPGSNPQWTPLFVLIAIAAALIAAGLSGFRRRDIPVT